MFGVITQELQNSNVSKKNKNNKVCVLVLGFQDHFINRSATQQNANYRSLIEGQNVYNVNQSTTICIRTIVFLISFHWWTCRTHRKFLYKVSVGGTLHTRWRILHFSVEAEAEKLHSLFRMFQTSLSGATWRSQENVHSLTTGLYPNARMLSGKMTVVLMLVFFSFFLESPKMCRSNKTITYNPSSLSYTATTRDRNKAARVRKGFKTNRRADGDAEQQVMELIPSENSRTHNAFNDAAR